MKTVAFFARHFTERGTEVAIYDYAHYNETLLGNRSIIVCFTPSKQSAVGFPDTRLSFSKFAARFPIIQLDDIAEMKEVIRSHGVDVFYTLTQGKYEDIYQFDNESIWANCRTVKHGVFDTRAPQGTVYCGISDFLNTKFNTNVPVIPHMISLPDCNETLRLKLGIPEDAIVIGRHGAADTFDIQIAHDAIREFISEESPVYFLFMNTDRFYYDHPRILHIDLTTDLTEKVKFINTCDAMIHARSHGEIFPVSIGEFCARNKPVITCPTGDLGHILNLGDMAIKYHSVPELVDIFRTIRERIASRSDWNAYAMYTPEYVMNVFKKVALG
jgi:hypothetical protein